MFSHPEIMPDFSTVEIVKSPSYSDPFSCYFYPLDREKSHYFFWPLNQVSRAGPDGGSVRLRTIAPPRLVLVRAQ
jgi:hypothetical protein